MLIKNLKQTCEACPSQWEFKTDGERPVYVRYRHGYLSVRVGNKKKGIISAISGLEIYGKQFTYDYFEGFIEWKDVKKRIRKINIEEFFKKHKRHKALNKLTEQAQKLDMGY